MIRLLLAGEGRNELGGLHGDPVYRSQTEPGVVAALLRKVKADGWEVAGTIEWKAIRKYRAGHRQSADRHNVLAAALEARERGCDGLVFVRDRDTHREREDDIEAGIAEAIGDIPVAGGVAVEAIESWIRALSGEHRSETHRTPARDLGALLGAAPTTDLFVQVVERADLARLPADAESLHRWLGRARGVLGAPEPRA